MIEFETGRGFYYDGLMYDKQENSLFQYVIYNSDYTEKRPIPLISRPLNHAIPSYRILEAYEKGMLKCKLKTVL